jgi:hypothetical protein
MTVETVLLPVRIAVFPYLQDHRFEGNAVYPAVEAMQTLARAVKKFRPQTDITAITDATFDKFLLIPPELKKIDALCSITSLENGDITAVLQTKTRAKKATFTRIKEHVKVHYPHIKPKVSGYPPDLSSFGKSNCLEILPGSIYRELVPFGPSYHNISEKLTLHKDGALAKVQAPMIDGAIEKTGQLGSPFVLDAAFHSACVWCQRFSGVVAFPVGIEKRMIIKPTRPGGAYISTAIPLQTNPDRLQFDICIYDDDNSLYEMALGVHMRDVSAGRLKPPSWIIENKGKN